VVKRIVINKTDW